VSSDHQINKSEIVIGIIKGVRGLHGELKVEQMTDVPGRFNVGNKVLVNEEEYSISSSRYDRNRLLIKLAGINTRGQAEYFKGLSLNIISSDKIVLPEGNYFHYQLLGLNVFDENDCYLGVIREILQTGANDVYVISGKEKPDLLLPAILSVIKDVDLHLGKMFVAVPEGL
tara:strand:+ start:10935 stop:11447 length:513 start_codon:yes stop_codon:yes gene_type:complete